MTWTDIRPTFEHLYIHERWTLSQTMSEIRDRHGFVASVNQYKKQIDDWRFSKVMKADEKDAAIRKFLQSIESGIDNNLANSTDLCKSQRWARARHKEGRVSDIDLFRILNASKSMRKNARESPIRPASFTVVVKTPSASRKTPIISPKTPDSTRINTPIEVPIIDKLYLTLPKLTEKYNSDFFLGVRDEEQKLSFVLDEALVNWKLSAYEKASSSFLKAGQMIRRQIQISAMPEPTLIYYLIPEAWLGCMPVFYTLARFIQMVVGEVLGHEYPFAIFVNLLQSTMSSIQRGVTIWSGIFESLQPTAQNRDQWTDASIYRSRFCRRNGQPDLAVAICRCAFTELEKFGQVPDHLKIDLYLELAEGLESNGDYSGAATAFRETADIASKKPRKYQEYRLRALERLAQIHEVHFWNFDRAQAFYVEAF